jgi:hypothetical protein
MPGPSARSNQGAPGTDGQDFADVEAYGVPRWLGELALALRKETYRPDPIRRVFIPKANSTAVEQSKLATGRTRGGTPNVVDFSVARREGKSATSSLREANQPLCGCSGAFTA